MSSYNNACQIIQDMNSPPGLTHPLLVENYAWVDQRLREMYNIYALTASNCDEYEAVGLLKENWAWIDDKLEEMCAIKDYDFIEGPLLVRWSESDDGNLMLLEDNGSSMESHKSNRSDIDISDISDDEEKHRRLQCQSPIPTSKYMPLFTNPFCNLDCERYNYYLEAKADEVISVSSFELDTGCGDFNYFHDDFTSISSGLMYDYDTNSTLANVSINSTPYDVNMVSEDEESYYYNYGYDCDGYDSP